MKKNIINKIIENKKRKIEFSIVTNIENSETFIFEKDKPIDKNFLKYEEKINLSFDKKKNGIIENTNIFIENYIQPIKVFIVGAVHIAQFLVDFAKNLNLEIFIIDPRGYFASKQRFPDIKIINKWPNEAFAEIKTDQNTALIALTHDPKIDDPALQHALQKKFFYIGALGSRKTHTNRCERLKETGFPDEQINKIFGPIGIKLGGRSAPEIALSIISQLVSEVYKK